MEKAIENVLLKHGWGRTSGEFFLVNSEKRLSLSVCVDHTKLARKKQKLTQCGNYF